jgi:hypothetical protein
LTGLLTLIVLVLLTALLSLSLAVLAALLLVFFHVVCHELLLHCAEHVRSAPLRAYILATDN